MRGAVGDSGIVESTFVSGGTDEEALHRFRLHYQDHDRGIYRVGIVLLTAPCVLFAWSDYILFGAQGMFIPLVGLRLAFLMVTIAAVAVVPRLRSVRTTDRAVTAWCLLLCALVFFINWTRPPDYVQHSVVDVLILMTLYFLFPLPMPLQAIAPLTFTAGNLAIIYAFKNPLTPMEANVLRITYILGNALGLYTARRMQRYRWSHFRTLEEERALRAALEEALGSIKVLQGMLPICAHCKKVRDDQGYWTQIEQYIRANSDAQFTHGICPECIKEHYGEMEHLGD